MIVFADARSFARAVFPHIEEWDEAPRPPFPGNPELLTLTDRLYGDRRVHRGRRRAAGGWSMVLCVESSPFSQFDLVVELAGTQGGLPHGLVCLAGSGRGFHGQRGRPWAAVSGNLHLTVHFRPERAVPDFGTGFIVLAAVSVLETLDRLPGLKGRATVKWVNDVLIGSAKVAGFVTHVMSMENVVKSAVLGIGLNVETTPRVTPNTFVPRVSSLREQSSDPGRVDLAGVLTGLLVRLDVNYGKLCGDRVPELLDKYRERSAVIGRRVRILSDPQDGPVRELAGGLVSGIGRGLELMIRGRKKPVTHGRLILVD